MSYSELIKLSTDILEDIKLNYDDYVRLLDNYLEKYFSNKIGNRSDFCTKNIIGKLFKILTHINTTNNIDNIKYIKNDIFFYEKFIELMKEHNIILSDNIEKLLHILNNITNCNSSDLLEKINYKKIKIVDTMNKKESTINKTIDKFILYIFIKLIDISSLTILKLRNKDPNIESGFMDIEYYNREVKILFENIKFMKKYNINFNDNCIIFEQIHFDLLGTLTNGVNIDILNRNIQYVREMLNVLSQQV